MEEIIIRQVTATEPVVLQALIKLFSEVFDMENFQAPRSQHLQKLLLQEDFIVIGAFAHEKIIGGLTGYILAQYYTEKTQVYLYDIGVSPDYQRMGIGERLLNTLQDFCRTGGHELFFVQAEKAEDQAVNFYRKNQPSSEVDVIHFTFQASATPE